jgi:hypothetical protein
MQQVASARVAELKRIHAEGLAAHVGAANPYRGQLVNAAVWRVGYRRMLDEMAANAPARRRWRERGNSVAQDRRVYAEVTLNHPGHRSTP